MSSGCCSLAPGSSRATTIEDSSGEKLTRRVNKNTEGTQHRQRNQTHEQTFSLLTMRTMYFFYCFFKSISQKIIKHQVMFAQKCHLQKKTVHPSSGCWDKDLRHHHQAYTHLRLSAPGSSGMLSGTMLSCVLPGNCPGSVTYK